MANYKQVCANALVTLIQVTLSQSDTPLTFLDVLDVLSHEEKQTFFCGVLIGKGLNPLEDFTESVTAEITSSALSVLNN